MSKSNIDSTKNQFDVDAAIAKVFEMDDAGKSDKEIEDWIESQPNKDEIFNAFGRMVDGFSSPTYLEHIKNLN